MSGSQLRRYTELKYLLSILRDGRLSLRDPSKWEDKNDSFLLDLYKSKKILASVLVLCLAEAPESYLHWKVYAGHNEGVCIGFNKELFVNKVKADKSLVHDYVAYRTIKQMQKRRPTVDDLPFVKRYAYSDEQEYRIICQSRTEKIQAKHIPVFPTDIEFIDINPWVRNAELDSIRSQIHNINGFENFKLRQSTIIDNSGWQLIGKDAEDGKRQHHRRKLNSEYRE